MKQTELDKNMQTCDSNSDYSIGTTLDQYFNKLKSHDYEFLSDEETRKLIAKAQKGDKEASDELIVKNQRLVVSIAKKFQNFNIPMEDLIQEGNIGMLIAIKKFDFSAGAKFSTYSVYWIQQSIRRAIKYKSSIIRIPVHIYVKLCKIKKIKTEFYKNNDREPSINELSKLSGLKKSEVENALKYDNVIYSMDYEIQQNKSVTDVSTTMQELLEDDNSNVERIVEKKEMARALDAQMKRLLTEKERDVLMKRYGIQQEKYTLEEIGNIYGVTKECIRQIEKKAIQKMYRSYQVRELAYA